VAAIKDVTHLIVRSHIRTTKPKKQIKMAYQKLQPARASVVTKSDTVDIPNPGNGEVEGCVLYVGTGGILRVLTAGGDDITFQNVPNGTFIPVQVIRVFASTTTANNIVALW
jgi:hypothetical protein